MAAPVSLAFRIAANLDALRSNLQDAQGQIETTRSAMQRMANSLDGSSLIANGNAMVKVVNDLGGASMLTEAEQAKVNATLTQTLEKYAALGQTAPPAMQQLADATKQTAEETDQFAALFDRLAERFAIYEVFRLSIDAVKESYRVMIDFVSGSVDAFAKAETAERQLTVAVQTQGFAIPGLAEQYLALGQAYEKTTAYSHTAIDSAAALFVQLGNVGPDMMDRAMRAATDLSSGLGIDLTSAVTLLSKAFEGHTTALGRYGIVLDQARVKGEGMGYVLDAIEGKVGGQAQAELDTYAGKVKQLGNAWDDFKEHVGGAFASDPLIQAAMRNLTTGADNAADSTRGLTLAWDTLLSSQPAWVQALGRQLFKSLEDDAFIANQLADAAERMSRVPAPKAFQMPDAKMPDVAGAADYAKQLQEEWKKEAAAADAAAKKTADAIKAMEASITGENLAAKVKELGAAVTALGGAGNLTQPELQRVADTAADLFKKGATLSPGLLQIALDFNGLLPPVKDVATATADLGQKWTLAIPVLDDFNQGVLDLMKKTKDAVPPWSDLGSKITLVIPQVPKLKDSLLDLGKSLDQMGSAIGALDPQLGAIVTDFGHVATAIDSAKKSFAAAQDAFDAKDTLSGILSMTSGIVGIATAAISAGKAVAGLISNALGLGTQGRDAVTAFAATFGGFDQLHAKLDAVGAAGEQMWIKLTQQTGRNDLVGAQQTIAQINQLLGDQTSYLQRLPAEMQQYGLTWEQAGAAAEQSHLDSIGANLVQSFADLTKAGFDVSTVTKAMSGDLNAYVDEALKTGSEVPEALKPLLQKMIDMGTLTDAAGNQITDLSTSGITFSETLTEGFQSVVDAINQMTEALTGSGPNSLASSFNTIGGIVVHPKIQPTYDGSGIPSDWSGGGSGNPQYGGPQAAGGDYYVTKPTTFLAGEAGPEHVSFSGANDSRASATRTLQPVIFQIGQRQLLQAVIDVTHASKAA